MKILVVETTYLDQMRLARISIPSIGNITVPSMGLDNFADPLGYTAMGTPVRRHIDLK
jgi:hypothetical protein